MTVSPPRPRTVVNRLHCRRQGHDWQQLTTAGGDEHWVCAHCGRVGERVPPRRPAAPVVGSLEDIPLDDLAPEPIQPEAGFEPQPEAEPEVEAEAGSGPSSATTVAVVAVGVVLVCGLVMLRRRRRAARGR